MKCNLSVSQAFLAMLDPDAEKFTFQTFGEGAAKHHGGLNRILHGSS